MPPPPAETSRPPRRRALGKGPGTTPTAAPSPSPSPEEPLSAADGAPAREPASAEAGPEPAADAAHAPEPAADAAHAPEPAADAAPTRERAADAAPAPEPAADAAPAPEPEAAAAAEAGPGARAGVDPGGEAPGGILPGSDLPGGDLPGGDLPGGDLPGGDLPGGDLPGGDLPGGDLPADDGPASALPAGDPSGGDLPGSDPLAAAPPAAAPPAAAQPGDDPAGSDPPGADDGRFTVRLANFEGPFDLLLQLISKHKLDVTEVALSKVTDEFMAHIRAMGPDWDLDQTTEFLVVAATLLDLKAARLLPAAEVEDEADLALLEARDLLFARLLQYRAYKRIAEIFGERWETEGRRYPRTVGLEAHHADLLPEVVISIGAEGFARLAVKATQPKAKPQVYIDHIHAPLVSVREQAGIVVALLRERGSVSFRELADGADDTLTVVARFLALLELYREKAVALDQEDALGELTVTWTGGERETQVTDEFDQPVEEKA
ncbi:segregation and condensation protein A [Streptomyces sp. NPDC090127]|uniref:segregation and condensation protein A n=1 Tax=Streptomyces sp. NPDC090127 TaxID=3365953 RepID=UPI0037F72B51